MADDEDWYKPHRLPRSRGSHSPANCSLSSCAAPIARPMTCELRFNGESYGWEAQFLERGELFVQAFRWEAAETSTGERVLKNPLPSTPNAQVRAQQLFGRRVLGAQRSPRLNSRPNGSRT